MKARRDRPDRVLSRPLMRSSRRVGTPHAVEVTLPRSLQALA